LYLGHLSQTPGVPGRLEPTRDEKVENLITNFSMIMMGMFEGVFATIASGLADALTKTAEALTSSMDGGDPPSKVKAPLRDTGPEVDAKIREVFSSLRKEVAEGFSNKDEKFERFIRDPTFDEGVRIVESHKLKLPPLTEHLSDSDLAGYVTMIQNEDPELAKMMQELGEWQKTTPRFEKSG
jgi:hypothetical protein